MEKGESAPAEKGVDAGADWCGSQTETKEQQFAGPRTYVEKSLHIITKPLASSSVRTMHMYFIASSGSLQCILFSLSDVRGMGV